MKVTSVALLTIAMLTAPWKGTLAQTAVAADKSAEKYTPDELMAMEKTLAQKADASGLASETLKTYATDYSMLATRRQSGQGELHEKFADVFVVLAGRATLVSGGHMVNGKSTGPGEVRGDSVQGGKEIMLNKGDIVHIPANIPHQLLLANGDTFQYFILKIQEIN